MSEINNEDLMSAVQRYPIIWDKTRSDYRDNEKKNNSWKAIALSLNLDSEKCKSRWKSIRDGYFKMVHSKRKTGSAGGPKERKSFKYSHLLDFLRPPNQYESATNIPADNASEEDEEAPDVLEESSEAAQHSPSIAISETASTSSALLSEPSNRKQKLSKHFKPEETLSVFERSLLSKLETHSEDECDSFGRYEKFSDYKF